MTRWNWELVPWEGPPYPRRLRCNGVEIYHEPDSAQGWYRAFNPEGHLLAGSRSFCLDCTKAVAEKFLDGLVEFGALEAPIQAVPSETPVAAQPGPPHEGPHTPAPLGHTEPSD